MLDLASSMSFNFVMSVRMSEPPFRPREELLERQKYFQNIRKHTYLKGPFDKITSVAIPLALAASSLYLIGRGIYNMSHGIGKKE
ncbi:Cytochrome c oxidase subunit VII [Sesbania bispinosa]|nr:Cytochrome c oxidase subunit VII [Sesbania bispinosa]